MHVIPIHKTLFCGIYCKSEDFKSICHPPPWIQRVPMRGVGAFSSAAIIAYGEQLKLVPSCIDSAILATVESRSLKFFRVASLASAVAFRSGARRMATAQSFL